MSYSLHFDCGPLDQPHQIKGAIYAVGGTRHPEIDITYNYAHFFQRHICPDRGIRKLYGMTAAQVVDYIDKVLPCMNGEPDDDYWKATEGNAKAALVSLRDLAALCPPQSLLHGD